MTAVPGRAVGPFCWISTGTVADRVWVAAARPSEEFSPNAKITAVAPNAIAARLTRVRRGPGERRGQAEADRPRQAQPGREPVHGVPAARVRGAAGRDGLGGRQPSGAQRGPERGQHGQGQHPGRRQDRRPPRHALAAHAVGVGRLVQHRDGQHVARHHPEHAPGQGRHADPAQVGHHDLRRSQADALQHADPVVPGDHRAADHVGHDEHRHDQADQRERDHERLHDRAVAGVLALRGEPGARSRSPCPAGVPL